MREAAFFLIGIIGGMLIGWSVRDYNVQKPMTDDEFEKKLKAANDRLEKAIIIIEGINAANEKT